jgi:hypothetical protein
LPKIVLFGLRPPWIDPTPLSLSPLRSTGSDSLKRLPVEPISHDRAQNHPKDKKVGNGEKETHLNVSRSDEQQFRL